MRSLLYAGVTWIWIGSLGVGVIGIVNSQVGARLSAAVSVHFGLSVASPAPPPPAARPEPQDDDAVAIDAALDALNTQDRRGADGVASETRAPPT